MGDAMNDDLVKRLEECATEKMQEAWGRQDGGQDLSIGAMLATEAAARIAELVAERDRFEAALARACLVGGTTYLVDRAQSAEARAEAATEQVAKLVDALAALVAAFDQARMVPGGVGGMTIEANIRGSKYNQVPAWPVEEARMVLDEYTALPAVKPEAAEAKAEKLVDVREAALKEAALAVANVEIGFHDGISGDWRPLPGPSIVSAACAAIRALSAVKQEGGG